MYDLSWDDAYLVSKSNILLLEDKLFTGVNAASTWFWT